MHIHNTFSRPSWPFIILQPLSQSFSSLLHILIHPYTHIHIIMGGQTFLGHFSPLLILFSHFYIHTDIYVQTLVRTETYLITTIYTFSHFLVFYPTFIFVLTHTHNITDETYLYYYQSCLSHYIVCFFLTFTLVLTNTYIHRYGRERYVPSVTTKQSFSVFIVCPLVHVVRRVGTLSLYLCVG